MHLTTSIAAFEAHFGEVCDPGSYSVSDFSFDSDLNILGCSSGAKFQWPLYNFSQISFYGCKVLYSMCDKSTSVSDNVGCECVGDIMKFILQFTNLMFSLT